MLKIIKKTLKKIPALATFWRETRDRNAINRIPRNCPHGFRFAGNECMENGSFEPNETNYLRDQFTKIDIMVNVGANYGYYALLARSLGKRVIAFEPHPLNYPVLLRNLELNSWQDVEAYPIAIADKTGLLKIYGSGTGASLIPGWAGSQVERYRLVPTTTLDRMLGKELERQRTLFVIDVEGAEYNVLLGAKKQLLLDPAPIWFIEISITGLQPEGRVINPFLLDTFQLFWENDYKSYHLTDCMREVSQEIINDWIHSPPKEFGGNFVFTKK
jgi:FkbM family methyltransferase